MTDSVTFAIDRLIADAARTKKDVQDVGAFLKSGKIKKFAAAAVGLLNAEAGISGFSFASTRAVFFNLRVGRLDGFNDPRLEGILNSFEYLNPTNTRMAEVAGNVMKTFRYEYDVPFNDGSILVVIEVEAIVRSDSPTCRKEIIGMTDPKPQPIYKIVCDDGADTPTLTTEREPADALDAVLNINTL